MIIFSDLEIILVDYLKEELEAINMADVKVSVKKSKENNLKEVIITANYIDEVTRVHRNATAVLDIYAPTYAEANSLSLTVESLIREATVGDIKKVEVVLGPTRTTELTESERRSISVDLVIKANNYNN
jgi:hypothetical protein